MKAACHHCRCRHHFQLKCIEIQSQEAIKKRKFMHLPPHSTYFFYSVWQNLHEKYLKYFFLLFIYLFIIIRSLSFRTLAGIISENFTQVCFWWWCQRKDGERILIKRGYDIYSVLFFWDKVLFYQNKLFEQKKFYNSEVNWSKFSYIDTYSGTLFIKKEGDKLIV